MILFQYRLTNWTTYGKDPPNYFRDYLENGICMFYLGLTTYGGDDYWAMTFNGNLLYKSLQDEVMDLWNIVYPDKLYYYTEIYLAKKEIDEFLIKINKLKVFI